MRSDFPAVAPRLFRRGGGVSWKASSRDQPALPSAGPLAHQLPFVVGKGEGPPPGPRAPACTSRPPRFPWGGHIRARRRVRPGLG